MKKRLTEIIKDFRYIGNQKGLENNQIYLYNCNISCCPMYDGTFSLSNLEAHYKKYKKYHRKNK